MYIYINVRFQSTHSLRSATVGLRPKLYLISVSIHALLAECDLEHRGIIIGHASFNPRTPCGVRRQTEARTRTMLKVSIHALLAECDMGLPSG